MYIDPVTMKELKSEETQKLKKQYTVMFGRYFPSFNYADFIYTDTMSNIEVYLYWLRRCIREGKPYEEMDHARYNKQYEKLYEERDNKLELLKEEKKGNPAVELEEQKIKQEYQHKLKKLDQEYSALFLSEE